ncbi:MAG: sigma-70 family RNA polymerase sigma factor [Erysipelotrichaceae bacterium]|nr:sigma-70 family RNA polymerase sigma factor [Erysipelotrichaceae bacterium]MBP5279752.1 sigma-70 family RNA polymerase sigma factor [Erysipelotrichaceae bacterium]
MEDAKIVELYWNRDEAAIAETRDKYGNYCFSIAYNILHNQQDCEEAVNDTYLGTWNAIPPHHPLNLATFVGKITRRLSLNIYRNNTAQKRGGGQIAVSLDELDECIADERSLRDSLDEQIIADCIDEFLGTLKENERKVFVCRYWYFDSIEDIASRFRYSDSKVKMMLKRTRDKLKDHLLKEGVVQ